MKSNRMKAQSTTSKNLPRSESIEADINGMCCCLEIPNHLLFYLKLR